MSVMSLNGTSQCLHDEGEEAWPLRLHLGCGGVYLQGYKNIDIQGGLASGCPQLVAQNATTIDNYYARLDGDAYHLPTRRPTLCDVIADMARLPYEPSSVDKIVAIQVLEHLTPVKALQALRHWHDLLWTGRPLVLSVPDMDGTLDLIDTDPSFAVRHLRGRRGDVFNTHHSWYTANSLKELLEYCGFRVETLPNFHFYPAIVARATKI